MVGIGIIGAGRMGKTHSTELSTMKNARLAAVYDVKPDAAGAMAGQHGMKICGSARELAENKDVDVVLVCSPTPAHTEGVEAAMAAGKHVFCEKPFCRNMADADKILKTAMSFKKNFTVGFVRRHCPPFQRMRDLILKGEVGRPRFCNVSLMLGFYKRRKGDWFADFDACGGVILDMLAHHLDLMNWMFGDADRLYADGLLLDPKLPEPADYVSATVTYKNGVICNVESGWQRFGRGSDFMEVYGDDGSLSYSWGDKELTHYNKASEMKKIPVDNQGANPYRLQMTDLLESIEKGRVPLAGAKDGHESLKLALGMIESAQKRDLARF